MHTRKHAHTPTSTRTYTYVSMHRWPAGAADLKRRLVAAVARDRLQQLERLVVLAHRLDQHLVLRAAVSLEYSPVPLVTRGIDAVPSAQGFGPRPSSSAALPQAHQTCRIRRIQISAEHSEWRARTHDVLARAPVEYAAFEYASRTLPSVEDAMF